MKTTIIITICLLVLAVLHQGSAYVLEVCNKNTDDRENAVLTSGVQELVLHASQMMANESVIPEIAPSTSVSVSYTVSNNSQLASSFSEQ